jgi:antitoxin YefM
MDNITSSEARARLYGLLDEAADSRRPILITGRRSNAVLVSEDGWRAIQETLHRLSIPGMRKSILEGMKTPVSRCMKRAG